MGMSGTRRRHILIVEDDPSMLDLLKRLLEETGFSVGIAQDALQGCCQALSQNPEIILLDFLLPAGNGASVLRTLRGSQRTCDTPVVFFTNIEEAAFHRSVGLAPRTYFLSKRWGISALLSKIREILKKGEQDGE